MEKYICYGCEGTEWEDFFPKDKNVFPPISILRGKEEKVEVVIDRWVDIFTQKKLTKETVEELISKATGIKCCVEYKNTVISEEEI